MKNRYFIILVLTITDLKQKVKISIKFKFKRAVWIVGTMGISVWGSETGAKIPHCILHFKLWCIDGENTLHFTQNLPDTYLMFWLVVIISFRNENSKQYKATVVRGLSFIAIFPLAWALVLRPMIQLAQCPYDKLSYRGVSLCKLP